MMVSNRIPEPGRQARPDNARGGEILVVEDDSEVAAALARELLRYFDQPVVIASSLAEANACLDQWTPPIALVDMLLPDGDGTELLLRLSREDVGATAVLTGAPSIYRATTALRTGAADFLVKPWTNAELQAMFERLARRLSEGDRDQRLTRELEQARAHNEKLRGKIDILCKDLVGGYQKLVTRMVGPQK